MKLLSTVFIATCVTCAASYPAYSADAELVQRLDRIERLLQSQGLLDMLQQLEALQGELSAMRGDMEFQNHSLEQLKKRQRDLYTDIDQRLQRIERDGAGTGGTATDTIVLESMENNAPPLETLAPVGDDINPVDTSQPAEDPLEVVVMQNTGAVPAAEPPVVAQQDVATAVPTEDPGAVSMPVRTAAPLDPVQIRAQYQQAFKLLKQSQYDQAIKAFREFLLINPDSEYSDNAQYWLGEAFYVTRQYELALLEYNMLLENYPGSMKLTHSLLKIGFCYDELGQTDEAVTRLESLKRQHAGTTAARLAEERLKKIAQERQQTAGKAN